ncbi:GNAT family N-acetyltransferase [Streptomyces sp. MUM 178J]|uniref:GNAT family N-acetyltransferase n=1 Tax=Streptomyces sp. MUM 178J TaxID=2791991 RepID=UPI001F03F667|nr:GNAT family N-acetyltransferase [Streptomyces sp. MUM 178J]WRQ82672.1 N-acetyltransferase family protein [Streptomyces sp. MUM 178J]
MAQDRAEVQVRAGAETDLEALVDLYNHYVSMTAVTFDTTPLTPEQRRPWLHSHPEDGPHRLLVAQDVRSERILGYTTSSPLSPKPAYATSVEVSVYCAHDAGGRGVGTRLYEALFRALEGEDAHRAYAGITQPNEASARLHARFGFKEVGRYGEVGRKFGTYWDVVWHEKELRPRDPDRPAPASGRRL